MSTTAASSGQESVFETTAVLDNHNSLLVAHLARTFTQNSSGSGPPISNPFLAKDPALDPSSKQFDAKLWAKTLLHAFEHDTQRYPRHTIGVAYQNLNVSGYSGNVADYQKDVMNVLWRGPALVRELLAGRQTKVQILRNFDGLVRKGEMLLVLGRPGR